jgi:hypothetical protein
MASYSKNPLVESASVIRFMVGNLRLSNTDDYAGIAGSLPDLAHRSLSLEMRQDAQ